MNEVGPSRLPRATAASVHPVAHSCKLPASILFSRTLVMMMMMMMIMYFFPIYFQSNRLMGHMQRFDFRATNGVSCRASTGCCVGADPATMASVNVRVSHEEPCH